jgi:hypothetical protein
LQPHEVAVTHWFVLPAGPVRHGKFQISPGPKGCYLPSQSLLSVRTCGSAVSESRQKGRSKGFELWQLWVRDDVAHGKDLECAHDRPSAHAVKLAWPAWLAVALFGTYIQRPDDVRQSSSCRTNRLLGGSVDSDRFYSTQARRPR